MSAIDVPENLLREAREVVTRFSRGYREAPAVYFAALRALPPDEQRAAFEAWNGPSVTAYESWKRSLTAPMPAPLRAQWEYHTLDMTEEAAYKNLNYMGVHGWELVSVVPTEHASISRFYFKQPKLSE